MKSFAFLLIVLVKSFGACPEKSTVHIKNYDGPIFVQSPQTDNWSPCCETCDNCSPQVILHNSNCHTQTYDADCKCVTKQSNFVPINSVQQNSCSQGAVYASPCYPQSMYYYCPEDAPFKTSLMPYSRGFDNNYMSLTYGLPQTKCNNRNCQCGYKYSGC